MITFEAVPAVVTLNPVPGQIVLAQSSGQWWLGLGVVHKGQPKVALLFQEGSKALTPTVADPANVRQQRIPTGTFTARAGRVIDPIFLPAQAQEQNAKLFVDGAGEAWFRAEDQFEVYWFSLSTGHSATLAQLKGSEGYDQWSLWRANGDAETLVAST